MSESNESKTSFSIGLDDVPQIMLDTYYKGPDSAPFKDAYKKFVQGLIHDGIDQKSSAYIELSEIFK